MFDPLGDVPQTAASARIGLFTPALASLHSLRNDSLNVGVSLPTNVVADLCAVMPEAVTQRDRIVGFLDPYSPASMSLLMR